MDPSDARGPPPSARPNFRPAPPPSPHAGAQHRPYGPAQGWIPAPPPPPPPPVKDPFWGLNPAWTIPSIAENTFWAGRPRPAQGAHFTRRWAATPLRLGAIMAGLGVFSVFIFQMQVLFQIVLGAPVFEEFLKFGIALLLVAWLPRSAPRAVTAPFRVVSAAVIGGGFGVMEHYVTYAAEDTAMFMGRVAFHSLSTILSILVFILLEPLRDVRTRWFSTAPSVVLHYVNNAGAVVVGVAASAFLPEWAVFVIPLTVIATLALLVMVVPAMGRPLRAWASRQVVLRMEAPGTALGREAAQPSTGSPPRGR